MSITFSGATRRAALVCLLAAASLATVFTSRAAAGTHAVGESSHDVARTTSKNFVTLDASTRGHHSSTPVTLRADGRDVLAFPPPAGGEQPLTVVYLHGVHGRAANGCPWLRAGATDASSWLVCPTGVEQDENGTASWGGDVFKQGAIVSAALHAAQRSGASAEPGVAVGFSQGGYVALDLVKSRLGHFRGLVLIAAPEAHPSAQKLLDAGVTRVALAAGSLDAAYEPLRADTLRLASEGIEARFVDLGRVGHTYATENTDALREAIAWAGGRPREER